jgi:HK97 family phage prohead protease
MTPYRSAPLLEVRADAQGVIAGYASTFNGIDSYGDTVAPGAFAASLARGLPVMLWAHRRDAPVGRWTELVEDNRGLRVAGELNLRTTAGRDAFEALRAGDLNGLSIGFTVPPGGAEQRGDLRVLKSIDLAEISIVTIPADPGARVDSIKAASKPATAQELQRALQDLGYSRRQAAAIVQKGFPALAEADAAEADEHRAAAVLQELRAAVATLKC